MKQWHTFDPRYPVVEKYRDTHKLFLRSLLELDSPVFHAQHGANKDLVYFRKKIWRLAPLMQKYNYLEDLTLKSVRQLYAEIYDEEPPMRYTREQVYISMLTLQQLEYDVIHLLPQEAPDKEREFVGTVLEDTRDPTDYRDCYNTDRRTWQHLNMSVDYTNQRQNIDKIDIDRKRVGPHFLSGRDPVNDFGLIENPQSHASWWACCGLPYEHKGCWYGETKGELVKLDIFYGQTTNREEYIRAVIAKKQDKLMELWDMKQPLQPTRWKTPKWYEELEKEIYNLKESSRDLVMAYIGSRFNNQTVMSEKTAQLLTTLMNKYYQYNAVFCVQAPHVTAAHIDYVLFLRSDVEEEMSKGVEIGYPEMLSNAFFASLKTKEDFVRLLNELERIGNLAEADPFDIQELIDMLDEGREGFIDMRLDRWENVPGPTSFNTLYVKKDTRNWLNVLKKMRRLRDEYASRLESAVNEALEVVREGTPLGEVDFGVNTKLDPFFAQKRKGTPSVKSIADDIANAIKVETELEELTERSDKQLANFYSTQPFWTTYETLKTKINLLQNTIDGSMLRDNDDVIIAARELEEKAITDARQFHAVLSEHDIVRRKAIILDNLEPLQDYSERIQNLSTNNQQDIARTEKELNDKSDEVRRKLLPEFNNQIAIIYNREIAVKAQEEQRKRQEEEARLKAVAEAKLQEAERKRVENERRQLLLAEERARKQQEEIARLEREKANKKNIEKAKEQYRLEQEKVAREKKKLEEAERKYRTDYYNDTPAERGYIKANLLVRGVLTEYQVYQTGIGSEKFDKMGDFVGMPFTGKEKELISKQNLAWVENSCWIDSMFTALFKIPDTWLEQKILQANMVQTFKEGTDPETAQELHQYIMYDILYIQKPQMAEQRGCITRVFWEQYMRERVSIGRFGTPIGSIRSLLDFYMIPEDNVHFKFFEQFRTDFSKLQFDLPKGRENNIKLALFMHSSRPTDVPNLKMNDEVMSPKHVLSSVIVAKPAHFITYVRDPVTEIWWSIDIITQGGAADVIELDTDLPILAKQTVGDTGPLVWVYLSKDQIDDVVRRFRAAQRGISPPPIQGVKPFDRGVSKVDDIKFALKADFANYLISHNLHNSVHFNEITVERTKLVDEMVQDDFRLQAFAYFIYLLENDKTNSTAIRKALVAAQPKYETFTISSNKECINELTLLLQNLDVDDFKITQENAPLNLLMDSCFPTLVGAITDDDILSVLNNNSGGLYQGGQWATSVTSAWAADVKELTQDSNSGIISIPGDVEKSLFLTGRYVTASTPQDIWLARFIGYLAYLAVITEYQPTRNTMISVLYDISQADTVHQVLNIIRDSQIPTTRNYENTIFKVGEIVPKTQDQKTLWGVFRGENDWKSLDKLYQKNIFPEKYFPQITKTNRILQKGEEQRFHAYIYALIRYLEEEKMTSDIRKAMVYADLAPY